jgi:hypothetical protein
MSPRMRSVIDTLVTLAAITDSARFDVLEIGNNHIPVTIDGVKTRTFSFEACTKAPKSLTALWISDTSSTQKHRYSQIEKSECALKVLHSIFGILADLYLVHTSRLACHLTSKVLRYLQGPRTTPHNPIPSPLPLPPLLAGNTNLISPRPIFHSRSFIVATSIRPLTRTLLLNTPLGDHGTA